MIRTRTSLFQPRGSLLILLLLAIAPIAALVAQRSPLAAVLTIGLCLGAILSMYLTTVAAIRMAALGLCAVIIVYPAVLPRRSFGQTGLFLGGEVDVRARLQLAITLGIIIGAAWLWLVTRKSLAVLTRLPMSLFCWYGCLVILSMSYTPDLVSAAAGLLKLLGGIVTVAVLAAVVQNTAQVRRVIDVMLASTGVVLVAYLYDLTLGGARLDAFSRLTTTWLHPNSAALMAFLFASIAAARFFTASSPSRTILFCGLTCFGALTGLYAGGKSAAVAAALALMATMLVVFMRRSRTPKVGKMLLIAASLAVVVGYMVVTNTGIVAHMQAYDQHDYIDPTNLTGRVPLWGVVLRRSFEDPFRGHGYLSTFALALDNGLGWIAPQAHNVFLQSFFDLGVLGLITMVLIYGSTWARLVQQVVAWPTNGERWRLSVELLAGFTVLTALSLVEDVFGGIFEIRSMLFMLVVFAVHQNGYLSRLGQDKTVGQ